MRHLFQADRLRRFFRKTFCQEDVLSGRRFVRTTFEFYKDMLLFVLNCSSLLLFANFCYLWLTFASFCLFLHTFANFCSLGTSWALLGHYLNNTWAILELYLGKLSKKTDMLRSG